MLELEHEFGVRDIHARLAESPDEDGPGVEPDQLERELRQAGIVRAVVYPPRSDDRVKANNAVARAATDRPFVPFARIGGPRRRPSRFPDRVETVIGRQLADDPPAADRYATDDRFHGFVLDPGRDGLPTRDALEQLTSTDRPLLVLAGAHYPPSAATELLDLGVPVILAHFGGYPLQRHLMREAIGLLDEYERCHLDTSHVRHRDLLAQALREHPDRVLFGSGTPVTHPSVAVSELLSVDIPEDGLRKAFERNPDRLVEGL